ncbi:1,4-dihydroxy-2-naphthoate polyprenyltransferase [Allokutzneria sp. NRRL B-24872]|uniref:1,4-dihydroxy-2-naphthoate polyprenyltransferase n=1 Tax=Allokutzneria sp. NRRL B-24872 TaxID=1137961 RepID=UPI000A365F10|nr:1,4-dihydroxy-2-naphthoate polyprenyltransferase [Allokutzneria sp. NRRL B-24872]
MASLAQWIEGARPRTLPNAVAPVLVGSGAAYGVGGFSWLHTALILLMSLALIVGVNYANDYSDGIRGTDEDRVGPLRLVGSGAAKPKAVLIAAWASLGLAGVLGVTVVVLTGQWIMLAVGALCIVAAWFYTGGKRPYGYSGFGELAVFVFFGLVAVLGTLFVQADMVSGVSIGAAVAVGAFSSAVLIANNLRDIPTDRETGKLTLAVRLGDRDTRSLYTAVLAVPFLMTVLLGLRQPLALLGFLALPIAIPALRRVLGGRTGMELIPVLRDTGMAMLVWSIGTSIGLALG